ncbi:hypothetical protein MGYG_07668 [Nannizzia gypsea CBS 118893]|uniref:Uncharacterized protein n=1 Tax=Arthroderma gypseum (strain ATCC MYA-4604 / CBS 118893) TaxID=535722 RepID=E4V3T8_ARTGP|nr:hypothetical protein MGYG_07668 [Nannizzia gypsea CBS 118893]EFR04662.1 hypothetical protein MGYG_07668 [Nannizzia gypsea CBS 118893]
MATASHSRLGPLSRKRKASQSPDKNMRDTKAAKLKQLKDALEELDEAELDQRPEFNSIGDVRRYNMAIFGPARYDELGNPAFYFPDICFDSYFSCLPSGLHSGNKPRYKYQLPRMLLLMHIWLVQLGDGELRTINNIQRAHTFWISMGLKTWEGRTYGYYQNWIPDAIWRLRSDILWICGHGKRNRESRLGPVTRAQFPLLSEGMKRCKARHENFLKREKQAKDESKKTIEHQSMKNLCSRVVGELTEDGPSEPKSPGNKTENAINEADNKPRIAYSGRVTQSRHAMTMEMQVQEEESPYTSLSEIDTPSSWESSSSQHPPVDLYGHAMRVDRDSLPLVSRSKGKYSAHR